MEWLNNIWAWFESNWDAISAGLSTVTTIGIIPLAKMIMSQKTNIATNTSSTKELKATIEETKELKSVVESNTVNNTELGNKVTNAVNSLSNLKNEYTELKTAFMQVNSKLGSIIDIMSIVYATAKDETIRNAIANIINSVKYNDSAIESEVKVEENKAKEEANAKATAELQAQIKELETKVKETKAATESTDTTSTAQTTSSTSEKTNAVRY